MRRPFLNSGRLMDGMSLTHEHNTLDSTFYLQKMDEKLKVWVGPDCSSDPPGGKKKKKKSTFQISQM